MIIASSPADRSSVSVSFLIIEIISLSVSFCSYPKNSVGFKFSVI